MSPSATVTVTILPGDNRVSCPPASLRFVQTVKIGTPTPKQRAQLEEVPGQPAHPSTKRGLWHWTSGLRCPWDLNRDVWGTGQIWVNHRRTYDVKFLVGVGDGQPAGGMWLQWPPAWAWQALWGTQEVDPGVAGRAHPLPPPSPPQGPSGDPRSWAQEVAEPGLTPEDTLSIFGFLPLSQKHNETTTRNILPSVRQPAPGPKALPP